MPSTFIDSDKMLDSLKKQMSEEMMAAAEPAIREAVEKAEKAMRQRLGEMFISLLTYHFSVERMGNDLRIVVKHQHD